MNGQSAVRLVSARAALDGDVASAAASSLRRDGVVRTSLRGVRHLSRSAVDAVDDETGRILEGLLEVDLGDALVMGWRKHRALAEAAHRTLATPGSEEIVALATHRITWTASPAVDLLVSEVWVNTFEFELRVELDVLGLTAVVRGGQLVGLRGGECLVAATLTLEGGVLAEGEQRIDLTRTLWLRHPVTLLTPAEPESATAPGPAQRPSGTPPAPAPEGPTDGAPASG